MSEMLESERVQMKLRRVSAIILSLSWSWTSTKYRVVSNYRKINDSNRSSSIEWMSITIRQSSAALSSQVVVHCLPIHLLSFLDQSRELTLMYWSITNKWTTNNNSSPSCPCTAEEEIISQIHMNLGRTEEGNQSVHRLNRRLTWQQQPITLWPNDADWLTDQPIKPLSNLSLL